MPKPEAYEGTGLTAIAADKTCRTNSLLAFRRTRALLLSRLLLLAQLLLQLLLMLPLLLCRELLCISGCCGAERLRVCECPLNAGIQLLRCNPVATLLCQPLEPAARQHL